MVSLAVTTLALTSAFLGGCTVFGIRGGYEQPRYRVVAELGPVEVRKYEPRLFAEASVVAESEEAGRSGAFRILAAYIFGENAEKQEVAMTAPVAVERKPARIEMTAPVESSRDESGRVVMRFFLPSALELATAPVPTDDRVRLGVAPEETVAVLRFRGRPTANAIEQRTAELLRTLEGSPWATSGQPLSLLYDPPWTLPFLRRNEVAVRVGLKS